MNGGGFIQYMLQHKKTMAIIAVIVAAGLLIYTWLRPAQVNAYKVTQQDYIPSLLVSGEVIADGSTLLSASVAGKVVACPVAKGELVKKGQLLIQLDDAQAQLDHDRAAAAVQMAQAQLQKASAVTREEARTKSVQADLEEEKASAQYARVKTLYDSGAVSPAEWEEAERQLQLSREAAKAARAQLESLASHGSAMAILQAELQQRQLDLREKKIILNEYKILSPTDGQLLDLYVKPGEMLANGSRAALLAAGRELRIRIKPDQRYAVLAALGNQAKVWITNAETVKWDAQVVYTEPLGNAEQGSFTAELAFTGKAPDLYPGQLLSVQLFAPAQSDAVILPDRYLSEQAGQSGVWLAVQNRAHFTVVQIGLRTGDGVVITQGLKAGDLVLEPAELSEGAAISIRTGKV
jgi:HlyD family secretion protein